MFINIYPRTAKMMINTEKIIEIVLTLTSNEYNVISKIIL